MKALLKRLLGERRSSFLACRKIRQRGFSCGEVPHCNRRPEFAGYIVAPVVLLSEVGGFSLDVATLDARAGGYEEQSRVEVVTKSRGEPNGVFKRVDFLSAIGDRQRRGHQALTLWRRLQRIDGVPAVDDHR